MAIFAYQREKTTKMATLLSWLLGVLIIYFGGFSSFLLLVVMFVSVTLASYIKRKYREQIVFDIHKKTGTRDSIQILSNLSISALSLGIYHFTQNEFFLTIYACLMAVLLADTLGSELGILSKKDPVDICRFKKIQKGLSGGITGFGLLTSLLGSLIIAGIYFFMMNQNISMMIFIVIIGFLGSLLDSVYGSLFQVSYQCQKCQVLTEKEIHCQKETLYQKGFKWMNNDFVNFAVSVDIFLLVLVIYYFF